VVREHAEGVDLDLEPLRRDGEEVEEDVVRRLGGTQDCLSAQRRVTR